MASLPTSAPGKTRIDEKLSQTSWNFAEVYLASLVHTIFPLVEKKNNTILSHGLPTEKASHPT